MNVLPIDLTAIVAVVLGMLVILIPIAGLTARFALKPTAETLSRFFQSKDVEQHVAILERRMALLESQMESMDASLARLADAAEFDRELGAGDSATPGLPGGMGPR